MTGIALLDILSRSGTVSTQPCRRERETKVKFKRLLWEHFWQIFGPLAPTAAHSGPPTFTAGPKFWLLMLVWHRPCAHCVRPCCRLRSQSNF